MPNNFAEIVLYSWPLVVFVLFKRLSLREALVWSIVAGYLLLPTRTGFDLPLLPTVDKTLVPSFSAAIMCFFLFRKSQITAERQGRQSPAVVRPVKQGPDLPRFAPKRGQRLFWGLLLVLFLTPLLTALNNGEAIKLGARVLRGMAIYDAMSMNSKILVEIIPFLLARRFLGSEDGHKTILKILVAACFAYSFLALYEVRMSPQLNRMFYGFFPHSWSQHIRGDGFRPLVFLQHGLWLSIFICYAVIAAFSYWKAAYSKDFNRLFWLLLGVWLFGVLVLSKSLGALVLALLFVPVTVLFGRRIRLMIAAMIAFVVFLYPMARGGDLVPVDAVYEYVQTINGSRARSFNFRIHNEDILLEKANMKPLTGWGAWARSRVYTDQGIELSTTDGYWVIIMGKFGWLGYLAHFGMLCLPLIFLCLNQRKYVISGATAGLAVILCVGLIDLIPNATITPVLWMIAGAILGYYQTATGKSSEQKNRFQSPARMEPVSSGPVSAMPLEKEAPLHQRRPRQMKHD